MGDTLDGSVTEARLNEPLAQGFNKQGQITTHYIRGITKRLGEDFAKYVDHTIYMALDETQRRKIKLAYHKLED